MASRLMDQPRHGGHLAAAALKREGVEHLFTLSGGHIAPIYDGCVAEGIRIVDFRHEQAAAHAADGWARVTGRPGVAAVTAGPGVTDSVTGIANAMYANSPMVVLGGKSPLGELERGSLQEMDHVALVRSITKWARTCWETGRIADYLTEAFRHATAGRMGPVFLDIPLDVQLNVWPAGVEVPQGFRTEAGPLGDPDHVARAVRLLRDADHPIVFAGAGVRWSGAHEALAALADALKLPVFLNSLGRGCLPPDHPSFFSAARKYALGKADVILALGVDWDFRLGFGRKGMSESVRVIQVDVDAVHIGRNRPVDVGIVGDGGDIVGLSASIVHARAPGHWLDPGPFGCLGVGPSFAMAAKLDKPDKQVMIVYGDGSFGLNAMEYESAIRQDIPFVGVIGNDGAW